MVSKGNIDREADYKKLNITNEVSIESGDLPLHCPTNMSALWCAHPKIFLAIEDSADGTARCPYCGTLYRLKD